MAQMRISLIAEIEKIQRAAAECKVRLRQLGVFIFFSMDNGDGWVLEVSESDAVQVVAAGQALEPPVEEDPETIEINWSHTFTLRNRTLFLTAYADKTENELVGAPTQQIRAAIRRIKKQYPAELMHQLHLSSDEVGAA
jgi:hypothetical protein